MKTNKAIPKKYKFNIVDTVVLVLVVLLALSPLLIFRPFQFKSKSSEPVEKTITYMVEFKDLSKLVKYNIRVGETAIGSTQDEEIGRVTKVEKRDSLKWKTPIIGDSMELYTDYPYNTIFVTVEVKCSYKVGEGYFVNGKRLAVGTEIELIFPNCPEPLKGYCINIQEKDEGGEQNA